MDLLPLISGLVGKGDPEIEQKVEEFRSMRSKSKEDLFGELCFCILAANTSAQMGIRVMNAVDLDHFLYSEQERLREELHRVGCRFFNTRSRFIVESRWIIDRLPGIANDSGTSSVMRNREYLAENLTGVGYKEASHFLRNIGHFSCAILDKHILRMMSSVINFDPGKPISKKKYFELEGAFIVMASELGVEPGILDLFMWKHATGRILK